MLTQNIFSSKSSSKLLHKLLTLYHLFWLWQKFLWFVEQPFENRNTISMSNDIFVKLLNCNKLESTLDFFVSNHELSNWNQLYRDMLEAENSPQHLYRDKNRPLNYTQHMTIRWKSQARCNTISHLCKCSKEFELSQHGLSTQSHDFNYFTLFEAGPKS